MDKFQELLTEAAQLKEAQLKGERKNYESLPDYLKAGLNYARKYEVLRRQDYLIQMHLSEKLKKQGNELFRIEHYQEALAKYQEALGVFRFIRAKSYDNMKDEDLEYCTFALPEEQKGFSEEYCSHMVALYLNICSCLTKLNRKEDAIHSSDEALRLKESAKGYYKKAQAYLQYINRETSDIKLGFYYLNKSYELSQDPAVVQQMHKIKKEIDNDREKEKKWFKFMFDKNSQPRKEDEEKAKEEKSEAKNQISVKPEAVDKNRNAKVQQLKNLQRQKGEEGDREDVRLQKTKEKLSRFTDPHLTDQEWLQQYQGEFISRHGSKIYSIIQLYGYKEYLGQYKSMLAQCLELKRESVDKRQLYSRYFQWLREHPIDKINKYTERYALQTKWIAEQRQKQKQARVEEEKVERAPSAGESSKIEQKATRNIQERIEQILSRQPENPSPKIEVIPKEVEETIENASTIDDTSQADASTDEEPIYLNPPSQQTKQNKLKLYSFLFALLLILTLKLFL